MLFWRRYGMGDVESGFRNERATALSCVFSGDMVCRCLHSGTCRQHPGRPVEMTRPTQLCPMQACRKCAPSTQMHQLVKWEERYFHTDGHCRQQAVHARGGRPRLKRESPRKGPVTTAVRWNDTAFWLTTIKSPHQSLGEVSGTVERPVIRQTDSRY